MLKSDFPLLTERISVKVGMLFSKIPISANAWTLISLLPALLGFFALEQKQMLIGILFFALSAFFDLVDGAVARVTGSATALGAFLDGMMDRVVEGLLIFGLVFYGIPDYALPGYLWAMLLLFFGTGLTSFAKAYADHRGAVSKEDVQKMGGFLERPERLILVFGGMLASFYLPIALTYFIIIATFLAILTVLQRILFVFRNH